VSLGLRFALAVLAGGLIGGLGWHLDVDQRLTMAIAGLAGIAFTIGAEPPRRWLRVWARWVSA
jgi:hypothetical protein